MQALFDWILPPWLIVLTVVYVIITYAIRFWLNNTPFRWRYVGLGFAWLPYIVFYGVYAVYGLEVARAYRWLLRAGLFFLLLAVIIHNENTWCRLWKALVDGKYRVVAWCRK